MEWLTVFESSQPFIIAEISGNHGGDIGRAFALIEAAAEACADAVKFQTYEARTITIDHDSPQFVVGGELWAGRRLYDLYLEAQTPFSWHEALFEKAREAGITAFSSPFDAAAVELLERLNTPFYKIASCELVDVGLIGRVADTGKPIILSTGMATVQEIAEAIDVCKDAGNERICLLHCVSGYPTSISGANLARINDMRQRFGCKVGLSDHSKGITAAVAATALGAVIIEKHLRLDAQDAAVDGEFSLAPDEFKEMVQACRDAKKALGEVRYGPTEMEMDTLRFRRSLYIVEDIKAGERLGAHHVRSIRPSGGLHTRHLDALIGRKVARDLSRGHPLAWEDIASEGES